MRHLTRDKIRSEVLLERARTIAVVGPATSGRNQATVKYLRAAGYDVVGVPDGALRDVPGGVDLVLVFGAPADLARLLEEAAAKRVDAVWFTQQSAGRQAGGLARRLGLTVVVDADVVRRHRERQRTAGQPSKPISRRRGRAPQIADDPSVARGWTEAGGGGSQGGGGGRAAMDEKKTRRSGRR